MQKKSKMAYRHRILGLITVASAFAFITLMGRLSLSSDDLSERAKRQKIEDMYNGYKEQLPGLRDISADKVMIFMAAGNAVLIDVRELREQQVSMLPGAITENQFINDAAKYKDAVKIAYCTIGYRSGKFAQKLEKQGIPVVNLRGGILAWIHDGGKVYDQNGETHRIHVYSRKWNLGPKRYQAVW
jgi:sodium/bile acid cotransporter 7